MLRIWTSGQSFLRKIILQFEFIYNAVQLFFTWTALANFYLAFFFVSLFFALSALAYCESSARSIRQQRRQWSLCLYGLQCSWTNHLRSLTQGEITHYSLSIGVY